MKNLDEFYDALTLAQKREANSNLKACAPNVFYIHDPELEQKITETGKKFIEKYKELFNNEGECYVTKDALDKFNEMLHDGKHTREECYNYLVEEKNKLECKFYQKNGFPIPLDFMFLYPESISSYNKKDIINKNKNKHMERYIEDYLNPNNELGYSYSEIKELVQNLHKQGKSIPEIKNYLMENLDIVQDYEEQLIYEKLIDCMINNKRYCDRQTREVYQ